MTYLLRRMSGKAIRLVARYLARRSMGGRMQDTPEVFFAVLTKISGMSQVQLERIYDQRTDGFEEALREDDAAMARDDVREVCAFVHAQLGEGFYLAGEVAADHRIAAAPSPPPAAPPPGVAERRGRGRTAAACGPSERIRKLLRELGEAPDPGTARRIRRTLRRLGHRGGLRYV